MWRRCDSCPLRWPVCELSGGLELARLTDNHENVPGGELELGVGAPDAVVKSNRTTPTSASPSTRCTSDTSPRAFGPSSTPATMKPVERQDDQQRNREDHREIFEDEELLHGARLVNALCDGGLRRPP